jgi:hypothetical protein
MILIYEPDLDWLIANSGVYQEDDFTGTIRLLTIDRTEFNSVEMTSGEGEYVPTNQVQNKRMKMNCESGPGSNGGGGSSGEGGPESGGDSGNTGNDGGTGTNDESGNSSGESGGTSEYTAGTAGSCSWLMSDGLTIVDCGDNSTPDIEIPLYEPPAPSYTKTVVTCETVEAPTIGDGDAIGVDNSARFQRAINLTLATELDPDLLIDLSCEEVQEWLDLGTFEIDQSVIQKLDELNEQNSLGLDYDIQTLQESKGATLNMDYFPVRVNQLPEGVTPEFFLDILRSTFNSFLDSDITSFYGYNYNEHNLWTSDNPLGSILRFNMLAIGGLEGLDNPDDGSVITSDFQDSYWVFSTLQTPGDFGHPVSGNRRFGFTVNQDGSYTFYTRGIDRATGYLDHAMQETTGLLFSKADQLWQSFQQNLADYINNNGGSAIVQPPVTERPNWEKVERYLNGEIGIEEFGCEN